MSDVGHYILSVADFPRTSFPASLFHWAPKNRGTQSIYLIRNGGFRWDDASQVNFTPPQLASACKAATLRDAGIMKLHINWGHASAKQIKRVLLVAEGDTQSLTQHLDDVVSQRDACKAFEKAPHIPISGTSSVSMRNERLHMDLLVLGYIIALHIMDVFSIYSILARARSKIPQEIWGAFRCLWRPQMFAAG